jgi:Methyltransferase domain
MIIYDICPICNNPLNNLVKKSNIDYLQCSSCGSVFCAELDNSNKIGGQFEMQRNKNKNIERIERVNQLAGNLPKENIRILDFGCGHGYLVSDLRSIGYNADGYDLYNQKFSMTALNGENYNIITCVETIEHTVWPFEEIDLMRDSLITGGVAMIETGFVNVAVEDNIEVKDYFYIAPDDGHSTIMSHHGLDVLMCRKGFVPVAHFNRHVRLYKKI